MFYRSILAAVAAIALASPVFADDTTSTTTSTGGTDTSMSQTSGQQGTGTEQGKIDLNKATTKQLMSVKGLNAAKARAIIAYRKKHGDFKSTDELSSVKGFKNLNADTMKSIQDQLTVSN
jgi:competence protein ComEA